MTQKLLTINNTKTVKGRAMGYETAILHLLPSDLSGHNVCPKASEACRLECINYTGLAKFKNVQAARKQKTLLYFNDRERFEDQLKKEIDSFIKKCEKEGLIPTVRLNGTSDLPLLALKFAKLYPAVTFYDYTKVLPTLKRSDLPSNYDLTFSRSESNQAEWKEALRLGFRVAVVTSIEDEEVLREVLTIDSPVPVVDGDETDLRFLDPSPSIVRLRPKGAAKKDRSGFVVWHNEHIRQEARAARKQL